MRSYFNKTINIIKAKPILVYVFRYLDLIYFESIASTFILKLMTDFIVMYRHGQIKMISLVAVIFFIFSIAAKVLKSTLT